MAASNWGVQAAMKNLRKQLADATADTNSHTHICTYAHTYMQALMCAHVRMCVCVFACALKVRKWHNICMCANQMRACEKWAVQLNYIQAGNLKTHEKRSQDC